MAKNVLIDVNVPKEVCERLNGLGYEAIYLTELFSWDIEDEKIFEWMEENKVPIITRDKGFPENGGNLKVVVESESSIKLARQAISKLMDLHHYPKPLTGC